MPRYFVDIHIKQHLSAKELENLALGILRYVNGLPPEEAGEMFVFD